MSEARLHCFQRFSQVQRETVISQLNETASKFYKIESGYIKTKTKKVPWSVTALLSFFQLVGITTENSTANEYVGGYVCSSMTQQILKEKYQMKEKSIGC